MRVRALLIAFVLAQLTPFSGAGADDLQIHCIPASDRVRPFESFSITLLGAGQIQFSATSKWLIGADGGSDVSCPLEGRRFAHCVLEVQEYDIDHFPNGDIDVYGLKFHLDMNDWAAANIDLGRDDDGLSAFVHFYSDGPSARGFYTCTELR